MKMGTPSMGMMIQRWEAARILDPLVPQLLICPQLRGRGAVFTYHCSCIVFPYNREIFLCIHVSIRSRKLKEAHVSESCYVWKGEIPLYVWLHGFSLCPADSLFTALPGPCSTERVCCEILQLQCLCDKIPKFPQWKIVSWHEDLPDYGFLAQEYSQTLC